MSSHENLLFILNLEFDDIMRCRNVVLVRRKCFVIGLVIATLVAFVRKKGVLTKIGRARRKKENRQIGRKPFPSAYFLPILAGLVLVDILE